MHKLNFEETDDGRKRYELCFQSVALAPADKRIPATEWDDVVSLVKKLKSIGQPAKEKIGSYTLYDLREGGGEVILERSEMKMLIDFVSQPIWRPLAIEEAQDLKRWLEKIPKVDGSLRKDARPEEKRRAGELAGSITPSGETDGATASSTSRDAS